MNLLFSCLEKVLIKKRKVITRPGVVKGRILGACSGEEKNRRVRYAHLYIYAPPPQYNHYIT